MAFWVLLPVLVLLHNTGGSLGAEVRSSIVGGKTAEPHAWKWMAYMRVLNEANDEWGCGATILTERWVMSARSCWEKKHKPEWDRITITVGSTDLDNGFNQMVEIGREPINHPTADLALFITSDPIKMNDKVEFMTLPSKGKLGDTSLCWIIGWGDAKKGIPLEKPQNLQQRKISIISNADCKKKIPDLGPKELCAKDYACDGDYGGPLVCKQDNSFVQVGIMISGKCDTEGKPGVYTPVYEYFDWIKSYIETKPPL
ncbi:tryptase-like [Pungitius pungitius]|uniref:tryptase-like n=1 Tax=Pungitius pungitius TaxID=134920 RepID=UPI002E140B3B